MVAARRLSDTTPAIVDLLAWMPSLSNEDLETLAETAIDLLDDRSGDPDLECSGDLEDDLAEDGFRSERAFGGSQNRPPRRSSSLPIPLIRLRGGQ